MFYGLLKDLRTGWQYFLNKWFGTFTYSPAKQKKHMLLSNICLYFIFMDTLTAGQCRVGRDEKDDTLTTCHRPIQTTQQCIGSIKRNDTLKTCHHNGQIFFNGLLSRRFSCGL